MLACHASMENIVTRLAVLEYNQCKNRQVGCHHIVPDCMPTQAPAGPASHPASPSSGQQLGQEGLLGEAGFPAGFPAGTWDLPGSHATVEEVSRVQAAR